MGATFLDLRYALTAETTGGAANGLIGYLFATNVTCFTHGTYKIDAKKTGETWQVRTLQYISNMRTLSARLRELWRSSDCLS